jgi:protocatechuate 4,5-dioxygenase beta chain
MPVVFGMASSHAPSLFAETYDGWQRVWKRFSGDTPQPPQVADEGPDAVADFVARTAAAYAELRRELTAAQPDVVLVLAGDQNEWFDAANLPNLMIYAGDDDIVGFHNFGSDDHDPRLLPWEHPDRFGVRLKVDRTLADHLLDGLVGKGFDVAISRRVPVYDDPRRTVPHALVRPLPLLLPNLDVPIVPIMMKTVERSPAILSGDRCLALGRAIEAICRELPQRIAIYGSGGMSHDPLGPRSGWVDEPLDRWFLEQLAAGTPNTLGALYSFRSAATESGTGELRTWLPVAAAMNAVRPGVRAKVVDYFVARKSTCGIGWVTWAADALLPANATPAHGYGD